MNLTDAINDSFNDVYKEPSDWKFEPVTFEEFVTSPEHMNHPGLTPEQRQPFADLVGVDPKTIFTRDRLIHIITIMWGKGCKCKDSLVLTADGKRVPIQDFRGCKVVSFTKEGASSEVAADVVKEGTGECLRFITAGGAETSVYKEHYFYARHKGCSPDWIKAKDLKVGDSILQLNNWKVEDEKNISNEEARFLGYVLGDGTMPSQNGRRRFTFNSHNAENKKDFTQIVKQLFDCETRVDRREDTVKDSCRLYPVSPHTPTKLNHHPVYDKLREWGLIDCHAHQKFVPEFAFGLSRENIANILGGLWSTDGHISVGNPSKTTPPEFGYTTKSRQLALDVKYLLLRIGIYSQVDLRQFKAQNGIKYPNYRVRISRVLDCYKFASLIRVPGKNDKLEKFKVAWKSRVKNAKDSSDDFTFDRIKEIEKIGIQDYYTTNVETTSNYVSDFMVDHNSGKDLTTSMFQNYIFYLTLCLDSPTRYFGMPGTEEQIDIVNVAQNQTQSVNVFFKRFTARLKKWPWLMRHFLVTDKGKPLNPATTSYEHRVDILSQTVSCTNSVRFHSLHSASQSYEGLNVLMFTIDEGSAFPTYDTYDAEGKKIQKSKADDILDVLESSASSRNWPWIGINISYPRAKDCFIMRQYALTQVENAKSIGSKAAPWDVLPKSKYSGKFVEWEGYSIPAEKLDEAVKNPEGFKLKYLCEVSEAVTNWFRPQSVALVFKRDLKPIVTIGGRVETLSTGMKVLYQYIEQFDFDQNHPFLLAGDYSTVNDRTSISVGHGLEVEGIKNGLNKRLIVDAMITWQPDKKSGIFVSHQSIHDVVDELVYTLPIERASLDQLESALTIEKLNAAGIPTEKHNVNDSDYILLRNLIDAGLVESYYFELLKKEFGDVRYFPKRRRVDHISTGSKDVLDTLCALARLLYKPLTSTSVKMDTIVEEAMVASDDRTMEEKIAQADDWTYLIPGFLPNNTN